MQAECPPNPSPQAGALARVPFKIPIDPQPQNTRPYPCLRGEVVPQVPQVDGRIKRRPFRGVQYPARADRWPMMPMPCTLSKASCRGFLFMVCLMDSREVHDVVATCGCLQMGSPQNL